MANSVGTQTDMFTNAFLDDELKDSDRTFSFFFSSQRMKHVVLVERLPLNADSVRYVECVDHDDGERIQQIRISGARGIGELMTWFHPIEDWCDHKTSNRSVFVEVLLGPDGCGKTLYATAKASHHPGGCFIIYQNDLKRGQFLENYRGEKNLIVNGFYDGCMNITMLLAFMSEDRVRIKTNNGLYAADGFLDAAWTRVTITSEQKTFCSGESDVSKLDIQMAVGRWFDCHTVLGLSRLRSQLRMLVGGENMPEITAQQQLEIADAETDNDSDF